MHGASHSCAAARLAARGDSYMGPTALLLTIALTISGCEKAISSAANPNNTSPTNASVVPVAGTNPAPDPSGDWVRPARDHSSTRFSQRALTASMIHWSLVCRSVKCHRRGSTRNALLPTLRT